MSDGRAKSEAGFINHRFVVLAGAAADNLAEVLAGKAYFCSMITSVPARVVSTPRRSIPTLLPTDADSWPSRRVRPKHVRSGGTRQEGHFNRVGVSSATTVLSRRSSLRSAIQLLAGSVKGIASDTR